MDYEIRPIDSTSRQPAFELVTKVFVEGSTLHKALMADLSAYREFLYPSFKAIVGEGLSVAAFHKASGRLAGCMLVTDFHNQVTQSPNSHPIFAPMSAITAELCRQYRQKRSVCVGETILVDMGAVSMEDLGVGVYQRMRLAVQETAARRGFRKVVGELSSIATQKVVLLKLDHRAMAEVDFATFEYQGNCPFKGVDVPPSIILAEGDL